MPHPKPHEIIPVSTLCYWKKRNNQVVIITGHVDLYGSFLHYEIREVAGRPGLFVAYHDDLVIKDPEQS